MKKSTKFVSLADVAKDFLNSDEAKKLKAKFDAEKAKSPARFARKHDFQAMQAHMSADCNFACAAQRYQMLSEMRSDYDRTFVMHEDFDEIYAEYQQYVLDAADYIRQYRERIAVLDQAIIDEDNSK